MRYKVLRNYKIIDLLNGSYMEWDYIIIGAGSSGCALAGELASSGQRKVLLLESGGNDRSPFIKVPAGQVKAIGSNDWGYVSQPDPSRDGKSESWARGHVLGGSSSINGTMYVRGAPADYDRWAAKGNTGWSYQDVLPIFKKMAKLTKHGTSASHLKK